MVALVGWDEMLKPGNGLSTPARAEASRRALRAKPRSELDELLYIAFVSQLLSSALCACLSTRST